VACSSVTFTFIKIRLLQDFALAYK
jgi:hypothetical protein